MKKSAFALGSLATISLLENPSDRWLVHSICMTFILNPVLKIVWNPNEDSIKLLSLET